ncbi:MAG TPA: pseudouridine synthase [Acidobacteriaceae bacterium]|nr:pseudouridine synthase [Acidobacteriaceae bacterium]
MTEPSADAGSPQRLQKIIAAAGIASRRKAEELITAGRVQVNGETVTELGAKADPARDHIRVDGKLLRGPERPRYYVINKPKGYVTTASDPEGRPTVLDLIRGGERVFPVGRLDYSSEGLLLLTNDGALANALTRAAARVEKTYLVKVSGKPSDSALNQLRHGVMIDRDTQIRPRLNPSRPGAPPEAAEEARSNRPRDRVMTAPARVRLLRDADNPWYEMILIEGRNREIRKMFEEVGHHVEKIRRVGYGPLILDLEPGHSRELNPDELAQLRRAAEGRSPAQKKNSAIRLPKPPRPGRTRPAAGRPAGAPAASGTSQPSGDRRPRTPARRATPRSSRANKPARGR